MTATAGKTYYRPGLVFKAHQNAYGHQECCFGGAPEIKNPDGSLMREAIRPLWAEFGVYGSEYQYESHDGSIDTAADIRGGYFNLDEQARDKGWTDTEKEIVARHMLTLIEKNPGWAQFSLFSRPRVGPPWPTYDAMHHSKVGEFAETLGLLAEALVYEEQEKNRPSVVGDLKARLEKASAPATVEELIAE